MTTTTPRRAAPARRGWLLPAGLIALSLVPVLAGAFRLVELGGGARLLPDGGEHHLGTAGPLAAHIVTVSAYAVLGAFQFAPGFRARRRGWHRVAGRLLVLCGLVGALSALWLALSGHRAGVGALGAGSRLVFGAAWALFLVLGFAAARRRDFAGHRDWMIRGYAVGLGAGTQVLTLASWSAFAGEPGRLAEALLMVAGWLINLLVAERAIRRSRDPHPSEVR
ncbi:DUF2306 domain-containing protein [Saccharothrix xinjiangensis]|uniref:DUF2306 domain-containing protein n=1 Tax=Saccharothrix xinjiangensis TaxID=204798 RepID=A0ABV9Y0C3_9PSEU